MNSNELHWTTSHGTVRLLPGRGRLLGMELCGHEVLWVPRESSSPWNLGREFPVHPELRYCDAPLDAHIGQGDAVQFFNDGGLHGGFGEMEHHSPALLCGTGPQSFTETTITSVRLLMGDASAE